ncbi:hypothetical protein [Cryobacterium sp. PH31-O1]|uniref:hypothetical protein n=1 Tax=Cryobacterium sp. PH31-O1 TaxID=3046306 RepID=UPI0024BA03F4|nr:hypothetical protein [Cryobacterium sp. PH31-O1]MDJ0337470.1 hypothetical protein [Cryobacterium sp. PH31-O1]
MADPTSYALLFRRALAQHLEDAGCAVYRDDGTDYLATERGIYTNGPDMPTAPGSDNALVITSLTPIPDGRANMLYRVQVMTRLKGSSIAAENWAALITSAIDQKQNIPPGHNIAWAELFSEVAFTADSSGRRATSQTFHFMGRRP